VAKIVQSFDAGIFLINFSWARTGFTEYKNVNKMAKRIVITGFIAEKVLLKRNVSE